MMQLHQGDETSHRFLGIIHPQVEIAVVVAAISAILARHQNSRRLLAALVAAGAFASAQCSRQSIRQFAFSPLEARRHRLDDRFARQQVALNREAIARLMPSPCMTRSAGVRRNPATRVHQRHLTRLAPLVRLQQPAQSRSRRKSLAHQRQAIGTEAKFGIRLRRHRARVRPRPRNHRPNRRKLARHRHAPSRFFRAMGDDGKSMHAHFVSACVFRRSIISAPPRRR